MNCWYAADAAEIVIVDDKIMQQNRFHPLETKLFSIQYCNKKVDFRVPNKAFP